ncbi:MAG TPA: branched chain amino acid aminotransferase [Anaerolineae bacterium]|jgi:branched-chain amino acid aminotransferase|nr:branched chain amino acid aminotransferase [Anaerolineae bacterium]
MNTAHAYFEGKIVPFGDAKVSIATHGLNYGTAAFGGLRGYWNESQKKLFVFRPLDHFKRFLHSSKMLCMELPHTPESLTQVTLDLLRADNWQQDVYVRPLCYKADAGIGVRLHDLRDEVSIFATPFGAYGKNEDGAHVTISSWRRIDDNVIPARGKISGAYANSALIKTDAIRAGFDEALVLDQNGHISEGTAMNVFMVRDGVLITPPVTDNILEGITRRTVLELAREELKIPVVERSIDRTETYVCEELFLTGTAAQVTVVTKVDFRQVGSGQPGEVTLKLRKLFDDVVHGRVEKYAHWNVGV